MASLFRQFYDYLFPKPDLVDSLPLLSRDFVDPHTVNRDTTATHYIRVSASVRTTRTAQDLIDANRVTVMSLPAGVYWPVTLTDLRAARWHERPLLKGLRKTINVEHAEHAEISIESAQQPPKPDPRRRGA